VTRPTVRFDVLNTPIEDYINNAAYLGYSFENGIKEAKLPVQEEQLLRKRCIDFTVALSKELQERRETPAIPTPVIPTPAIPTPVIPTPVIPTTDNI
jgi:hypothetical protein